MKSDGLVFGTDKIQRGGVRTFGGPPAKASVGCRSLEGGRRASMSYVLFHMDGWPDVGKLSVNVWMCGGVGGDGTGIQAVYILCFTAFIGQRNLGFLIIENPSDGNEGRKSSGPPDAVACV